MFIKRQKIKQNKKNSGTENFNNYNEEFPRQIQRQN